MNITLYKTTSPKETLKKTLTGATIITGAVRQESDALGWRQISLTIGGSFDSFDYNYLSIKAGGRTRYYFITDTPVTVNGILTLRAQEDVLMSMQTEILQARGLVKRSGQGSLYLDDGTLKKLETTSITTLVFPSGFSDSGTYILATAAGTGSIT